jgi:hypothetical protein|eukprot:SAG25_NODE_317_length_9961_cov_5.088724_11_plen_76_part_00
MQNPLLVCDRVDCGAAKIVNTCLSSGGLQALCMHAESVRPTLCWQKERAQLHVAPWLGMAMYVDQAGTKHCYSIL